MALHPELGPIAFVACIATLLPLPWHWRARNVATLSIIFWFFISNLIFAVDAVVWADNVKIRASVWCDITTKLIIGANMGLPAACLCIAIYLEQVASLRQATSSLADKRKRRWFEAFMCFGLPFIFMGLHFIVQGHRFDIIEGYGCRPATYYSIPGIFIVWLPPLVMASGSFVLSALALRHFVLRRLTFASHLKASNTALTTSRYLRLIAMVTVQMVGVITVTSYTLWFTSTAVPLRPWTTWDDVHSNFGRIDQFLAIFYPQPIARAYYGMWMMIPVSTFLFVAFFAFGRDAVDEYKKCIVWVKTKVLRRTSNGKLPSSSKKFVDLSSLKPIHRLPISNPVLQSSTSSDYTLPPYESATRISMSSLHKTITTLNDADHEYKYDHQLHDSSTFTSAGNSSIYHSNPKFAFQQPKTIGSFSDLSIVSPSLSTTTIAPSEPTLQGHGSEYSVKQSFSPLELSSPPSCSTSTAPPAHSPSRLRPLLLLGRGQRSQGLDSSQRPITYPSYDADWWSTSGAPRGEP